MLTPIISNLHAVQKLIVTTRQKNELDSVFEKSDGRKIVWFAFYQK